MLLSLYTFLSISEKKFNSVARLQLPKTSWSSAPLRSNTKKYLELRSAPLQYQKNTWSSAPLRSSPKKNIWSSAPLRSSPKKKFRSSAPLRSAPLRSAPNEKKMAQLRSAPCPERSGAELTYITDPCKFLA